MGSVATPLSSRTISCGTLRARHLEGAYWVLELSGEADVATVGMLQRELAQLATVHREDSMVDLTKLAFCDVASAHLILTAQETIPVRLFGATGSVKRVLGLLDELKSRRLPRYRWPGHAKRATGIRMTW